MNSKLLNKLPPIVKDLLLECFGALLIAIGIYSFAKPAEFTPGGVNGIALIIHYFLPWAPIGTLSLLINLPLIIISWRLLGRRFLLRTFRTLVIMAFFMDIVLPHMAAYHGNHLLASIFAGIFTGAGLAIVFSNGTCSGGTDLIIMCMKKVRPHMSFGQISLILDAIIIISGGLVYQNLDAVLYGFIDTITVTFVLDKITYGFVSGKMALIITEDHSEISHAIDTKISRGATIISATGSFSKQPKDIILCALSKQQMPELRRLVSQIDPKALVIVLEYNEVYGTGFQKLFETT